jgi:hypothetical protein
VDLTIYTKKKPCSHWQFEVTQIQNCLSDRNLFFFLWFEHPKSTWNRIFQATFKTFFEGGLKSETNQIPSWQCDLSDWSSDLFALAVNCLQTNV